MTLVQLLHNMADSINAIKYWFNGLPSEGVEISANKSDTIKFWFNGFPSEQVFVTTGTVTAAVTPLRTMMGVGY
jgi:hypothetical protein